MIWPLRLCALHRRRCGRACESGCQPVPGQI